jgi:hypothetical protein
MTSLSVYFKLHVLKQVHKWILLSSEMQHLECAGCVPQRRRKNPPLFRGFYPEDGRTRSPDLQNQSRKNLKSHTLTLYLWKLPPICAVQFMLLRDGWQTMAADSTFTWIYGVYFKGHATWDPNRWLLHLRVLQHSQTEQEGLFRICGPFVWNSVNDTASYQRAVWGQYKMIWLTTRSLAKFRS